MDLASVFGKVEMELAAKRIIEIAEDEGIPLSGVEVDLFDFETDKERHGFCHLLYHGWMIECGDGNRFTPSEGFIYRIKGAK